jgi:hypothetical protein
VEAHHDAIEAHHDAIEDHHAALFSPWQHFS